VINADGIPPPLPDHRQNPRRGIRVFGRRATELPAYSLFVAIAVCTVFSWYRGHALLWGSDASFPLSISGIFRYAHLLGPPATVPDARKLPFLVPWGVFLILWKQLHLAWNASVAQHLELTALLSAAQIGSYRLVRKLMPVSPVWVGLVTAEFYAFNLFGAITLWPSQSYLLWHYCLLPFVFLAWDSALSKGGLRRCGLAVAVWIVAFNPSYITTPLVVTDFALLSLLVARYVLMPPRGTLARRVIARGGVLVTLWGVLSLYWILPLVTYFGPEYTRGVAAGSGLIGLNSVTLSEAARLGGYWGLTSGIHGSPYYPWFAWYRGLFSGLGYAIPAVALVGVIAARKLFRLSFADSGGADGDQGTFWLLGLVACGCIVLATGSLFPFGGLKIGLLDHSLGAEFRSIYQRFMMYLPIGYVPLVAAGLWQLDRTVRQDAKRLLGTRNGVTRALPTGANVVLGVAALACLVIGPALPLLNGAVFDQSGIVPSSRIDVPEEYNSVARLLMKTDGTDRGALVFPFGPSPLVWLKWSGGRDGYLGDQPLSLLASTPILVGDPSNEMLAQLVPIVAKGGTAACTALELLDARSVVLEGDRSTDYLNGQAGWTGVDTARLEKKYEGTPCLRREYSSAHLAVFSVRNWNPMAVFGAPRSYKLSEGFGVPLVPVTYQISGMFYRIHEPTLPTVIVVSRPYDPAWRCGGSRPIDVAGLTAFRSDQVHWIRGTATITNMTEGRVDTLILVSVVGLFLMLVSLIGSSASRSRRRGSSGRRSER